MSKEKGKIKILEIRGPEEIRLRLSVADAKKVVQQQKLLLKGKPRKEKVKGKPKKKKAKKDKELREKLKGVESLLKTSSKKAEVAILPKIFIKTVHIEGALIESDIVKKYIIDLKGVKASGMGTTVYITRDGKYLMQDPVLTPEDIAEAQRIIELLFFMTDSSKLLLSENAEKLMDSLFISLNISPKVAYILKREILGYGVLDPLIRDPYIEDFQVPGPNIPVKILHREFGVLESNLYFNEIELDLYVEKMVHKANKVISLFVPYASVQLPEGHRLTVTYKKEITTKGSSIVIRKFPEKPWSITKLFKFNSISPEMVAWLMMLIEHKKGIIVAGVMGSGKTSTINGLCNLIPARATIVTIEDTPELRLAHKYWIQHKTREALTIDGKGSISMFDLVKHSMRESADYLIIGEVRGEEGKVWAQAIATGHGGITSFHAESPTTVIMRLISPPINVEKGLLTALYAILLNRKYTVITRDEETGAIKKLTLRRTAGIYDINVVKGHEGIDFEPIEVFKYNLQNDSFEQVIDDLTKTRSAKSIMEEEGWTQNMFLEEYEKRLKFLKRLKDHVLRFEKTPLLDYYEVSNVFWLFYEDPSRAYEYIDKLEEKLSKEAEKAGVTIPEKPVKPRIKILEVREVE